MFSFNKQNSPQVLNNFISVETAVAYSGYSPQYLRRLLRNSKLDALKVGQVWLINKDGLDAYLAAVSATTDHRFGPK